MGDQPLPALATLSGAGRIGSATYVRITPHADYLPRLLARLKIFLVVGTLAISLVSIGVLLLLIRTFVTRPIAELDRQASEIVDGHRNDFDAAGRSGIEVGRLRNNLKILQQKTRDSLARARAATYTDTLTAIPNRPHFNIMAEEALAQAQLTGAPLTLLFLDIHHFKLINDRYGHAVGDLVLANVAQSVERVVLHHAHGAAATVARLSGDEFAVLLSVVERDASPIADAILDLFSDGFALGHDFYPVGISIGIASYPDHAKSVQELVANADAAMQEAKARGRNRVVHFSDEIETERGRARLIQGEMTRIVPDAEFHLVYMPISDRDGTIGACEALLRWTSPIFGPISPADFMPLAERNGMFAEIDRWVVDHALSDYEHLAETLGTDPFLSINVSSAELTETTLVPFLRERIKAYGVPSPRIVIELTETVPLENENVFNSIVALRREGVHIAMDDFGAGFTSVLNLLQYEIDTIKLDRYFLDHLIERKSIDTLQALISLCHAENMHVVAEGIDSAEKWQTLIAAGCDYFQGYGIGPPMTIAELRDWAAAGNVHRPERFAAATNCGRAITPPGDFRGMT
nr:EAL domain-containing protein [Ancylobacter crimeensis]